MRSPLEGPHKDFLNDLIPGHGSIICYQYTHRHIHTYGSAEQTELLCLLCKLLLIFFKKISFIYLRERAEQVRERARARGKDGGE